MVWRFLLTPGMQLILHAWITLNCCNDEKWWEKILVLWNGTDNTFALKWERPLVITTSRPRIRLWNVTCRGQVQRRIEPPPGIRRLLRVRARFRVTELRVPGSPHIHCLRSHRAFSSNALKISSFTFFVSVSPARCWRLICKGSILGAESCRRVHRNW